jgi:glycosyltransferase involved in cell wall biosynthesis
MHLVLANQWYPPESGWGGVAMWNHAMAYAYLALGHQVTVIASRASAQIPALMEMDGIHMRRLLVHDNYRWRRLPGIGRYVRPAQQVAYARCMDRALRELHRERPIDMVEFAEVNAEGFFFAREPLAPFVVRCHTPTFVLRRYYDRCEMPYDTQIISWCEKDLIRRAHALTAPSRDMAQVIADECRLPVEKIAVIPNALASDQWRVVRHENRPTDYPTTRPSEYLTVLHVGRLERAKGVTVLANAIPQVLRAVPNARFVFIGDDRPTARGTSQRTELESHLVATGARDRVEFLGGVDQPTLWKWYRRADICVVPSMLYESFSYTCAQAMAAGKPVVASRIGGIPETMEDGVTGLLVKPGDAGELASAVGRLAQDPVLREQMGCAGREKVGREFDPINIAQQNLNVYERAKRTFERSNV